MPLEMQSVPMFDEIVRIYETAGGNNLVAATHNLLHPSYVETVAVGRLPAHKFVAWQSNPELGLDQIDLFIIESNPIYQIIDTPRTLTVTEETRVMLHWLDPRRKEYGLIQWTHNKRVVNGKLQPGTVNALRYKITSLSPELEELWSSGKLFFRPDEDPEVEDELDLDHQQVLTQALMWGTPHYELISAVKKRMESQS